MRFSKKRRLPYKIIWNQIQRRTVGQKFDKSFTTPWTMKCIVTFSVSTDIFSTVMWIFRDQLTNRELNVQTVSTFESNVFVSIFFHLFWMHFHVLSLVVLVLFKRTKNTRIFCWFFMMFIDFILYLFWSPLSILLPIESTKEWKRWRMLYTVVHGKF